MTYDMFNMPLSNSLAGTIDPATGLDACPISHECADRAGFDGDHEPQTGITGTIVTCPKYEADGKTLSPLAGQAVVANLMPGRYGVVATPAADRIARGEEWLQTNTLDGQKAHDSFLRDRRAELLPGISARRDTTCPSASPIRRSSMPARRESATAPTPTSRAPTAPTP